MTRLSMKLATVGAIIAGLALAACERPPMNAGKQYGYRGTAMEQVDNPRIQKMKLGAVSVPDVVDPAEPSETKASEIYQNVQVLGDLSETEFLRVMTAVTEWVSPEEGCGYCHNLENLAEDSVYTKTVSRRMFQMTAHINKDWTNHVGQTGVTCYTCHAGNPVPKNIWFDMKDETAPYRMAGYRAGSQNRANASVGLTSMTASPFDQLVSEDGGRIRVQSANVLPRKGTKVGTPESASIQETERTYAQMIHQSESLGVNCTFCHNSRAFSNWQESTPTRTTAWYGIRMLRDLNSQYLLPLQASYPEKRLGPHGDAPKANCATCHQGLQKPLNGVQMMKDYLELNKAKVE